MSNSEETKPNEEAVVPGAEILIPLAVSTFTDIGTKAAELVLTRERRERFSIDVLNAFPVKGDKATYRWTINIGNQTTSGAVIVGATFDNVESVSFTKRSSGDRSDHYAPLPIKLPPSSANEFEISVRPDGGQTYGKLVLKIWSYSEKAPEKLESVLAIIR